jgi:protein-S-isoprenylcysteine O-methyltransferase Ste14
MMLATFSLAGIFVFIPREEEFLVGQFGRDYKQYMEKVRWRLIPGIY